ncbi:hypothetical protein [Flavobacterium sp. FlaQc-50]|jgi:hypothetical protein|uniref:hypothetical protein n=1 Tax=unclassified Flavobacterium TaxID=196869 RepID=UPI003757DED0
MSTNNKDAYTVTKGLLESKGETVDTLLKEAKSVAIRGHIFDVRTGKSLSNAQTTDGCFKFHTTNVRGILLQDPKSAKEFF